MRIVTALAAVGVLGVALPAAAELDLLVNVTKTKNVDVTVDLDVFKTVYIEVDLEQTYEGAAEAHALANVENRFNFVEACDESCENGPARDPGDNFDTFNLDLEANIIDSINRNQGVVGVNQDVGNMVNQANILAFARSESIIDGDQIVSDAEAEIDQSNQFNYVRQEELLPDKDQEGGIFADPDHEAIIGRSPGDPDAEGGPIPPGEGSINDNNGIVGVNQNAGNMNNQTNAVAMVIGEGNATVLTEASLGQENTNNEILGIETVKIDRISYSVNGNAGVVSVNQSVGNNNNQGSSVAFGALKTTATIGVPGT